MCAAIHARCMNTLTEDDRRHIEQIHSSWIEFEIAGASHNLMTLCADDVEFCPPDAQPVYGRAEVAAYLALGTKRIHSIEISGCRIRGSNEIAYLSASYKTTFSATDQSAPKQVLGSHLWILQKRNGKWLVTLVGWSVWK
jgi:ketosteroid isomerase-like protein